ncbi:MAG TPA: hypothetical protein PKX93_02715, partial [bacterium]|nr:hypothetical protein [bacterium]
KREGEFFHVSSRLSLKQPLSLRRFQESLTVFFDRAEFVWTPNLCPEPDDVVGDHVFRAPAIVLQTGQFSLAVLPDLDILARGRFSPVGRQDWRFGYGRKPRLSSQLPMFGALVRRERSYRIDLGLADYLFRSHLYYRLSQQLVPFPQGQELMFGFNLWLEAGLAPGELGPLLSFLWQRYARKYTAEVLPQKLPFSDYRTTSLESIGHAGELVEFFLPDGEKAAGLRNTSNLFSSDIASSYFRLPVRCVWLHAWHNSLRTGFGIRYHFLRTGQACWQRISEEVKNLVLSAPEIAKAGFVPAIYDYQNRRWWSGVPRLGAGPEILDLAGCAHTGQWMLRWHRYLNPEPLFLKRCQKMAAGLLSLQAKDGSFPAYLTNQGKVLPLLRHSGQGAMVALFLAELYETTGDKSLLKPLQAAADFFLSEIIPERRYHDFETFFSCSEKPLNFFDRRTGQHAQNTLSLFWITETLIRLYTFTGEERYLVWARRCLDQLSLYQQVWNPPFLSLYTFGGFGVMNTDGEWNDMRQAFFSEAYFRAYLIIGEKEYFQRAVAALRAGYAQMSHPLHQETNPLRYDSYPPGLVPENFAHTGLDGRAIRSGFDWGGGALATMTSLTEILFGGLFVDAERRQTFGIDGLKVVELDWSGARMAVTVEEATGVGRTVKVVSAGTRGFTAEPVRFSAGERKKLVLPLRQPSGTR